MLGKGRRCSFRPPRYYCRHNQALSETRKSFASIRSAPEWLQRTPEGVKHRVNPGGPLAHFVARMRGWGHFSSGSGPVTLVLVQIDHTKPALLKGHPPWGAVQPPGCSERPGHGASGAPGGGGGHLGPQGPACERGASHGVGARSPAFRVCAWGHRHREGRPAPRGGPAVAPTGPAPAARLCLPRLQRRRWRTGHALYPPGLKGRAGGARGRTPGPGTRRRRRKRAETDAAAGTRFEVHAVGTRKLSTHRSMRQLAPMICVDRQRSAVCGG